MNTKTQDLSSAEKGVLTLAIVALLTIALGVVFNALTFPTASAKHDAIGKYHRTALVTDHRIDVPCESPMFIVGRDGYELPFTPTGGQKAVRFAGCPGDSGKHNATLVIHNDNHVSVSTSEDTTTVEETVVVVVTDTPVVVVTPEPEVTVEAEANGNPGTIKGVGHAGEDPNGKDTMPADNAGGNGNGEHGNQGQGGNNAH